jgi:hypothetical protein
LAADSPTPDLGLILLAFGNVEIRSLSLFEAAAGNGDAAPVFSFSSSAVPGEDPETGGIIVYNPTHEEPLFIRLNGADLTLASSALVQAQPGDQMTVTMAAGSAFVNTAAGEGALMQSQQLAVPLDSEGSAAGAPTTPTLVDEDLLVPLVRCEECELLEPLVPQQPAPSLEDIVDSLVADFDSAYTRCMAGNSRQVYRVMYYARLLKLSNMAPDELMSQIDVKVSQCATFEIEFNSVVSGSATEINGSMHVQGQGMIVSFGLDGNLDQPTDMPITHLSYDFTAIPMCPYTNVLYDGFLKILEGSMHINHNRLDITTKIDPVVIAEHIIYYCPEGQPVELPSYAFWRNMFRDLHMSEAVDNGMIYLFTPEHWKYTGNEILAEAIITDRQAMFWDGTSTENMWMVMLHSPGQ